MTSEQPTNGKSGVWFMHKWTNPHFHHLALCTTGPTHILTAARIGLQGHTMLPPKRKRFYKAKEVVQARDDLTLFCDIYNVFVCFFLC